MIIKRTINGMEVEIELKDEEIEKAYRQRDLEYRMEDVKIKLEEMYEDDDMPRSYDDEDVEWIAEQATNIMSKHDRYWDSYWYCFEAAIEEFMEDE